MSLIENEIIGKNFLENYFLKRKYFQAPIIYKILYDKNSRKEIFDSIKEKTVHEIQFENFKLDKNFNQFPIDEKNTASYPTTDFTEFLILSYYDHLYKEKILAHLFTFFTLFQFFIFKMFKSVNWENKKFIFLDNNRMIMNKICSFNLFLQGLMKINLFLLGGLTFYYYMKYISDKLGNSVKDEEKEIEEKYKRSILLYSKLKI